MRLLCKFQVNVRTSRQEKVNGGRASSTFFLQSRNSAGVATALGLGGPSGDPGQAWRALGPGAATAWAG